MAKRKLVTVRRATTKLKAAAKRIRTAAPRKRVAKVPLVTAGALDRAAEDPVVALATVQKQYTELRDRVEAVVVRLEGQKLELQTLIDQLVAENA